MKSGQIIKLSLDPITSPKTCIDPEYVDNGSGSMDAVLTKLRIQ